MNNDEINTVFESERLRFRRITLEDFTDLETIFKDVDTMYAWEHAFTDDELREWIQKNLNRYETDGFSYFIAALKNSGAVVGVMGPLMEDMEGAVWDENSHFGLEDGWRPGLQFSPSETWRPKEYGIAYILNRKYWGQGYAAEGAAAGLRYAFDNLRADRVIAQIRPENAASRKVAERLGMTVAGSCVKTYNGKAMPHLIYCITNGLRKDDDY